MIYANKIEFHPAISLITLFSETPCRYAYLIFVKVHRWMDSNWEWNAIKQQFDGKYRELDLLKFTNNIITSFNDIDIQLFYTCRVSKHKT